MEVMAKAGTRAQRRARFVNLAVAHHSRAQPSPNATSKDPVMVASVPPGKTTATKTTATARPAATDPAMMRATGPLAGSTSSRWFRLGPFLGS